jgi:hypothetical protein
MTGAACFIVAVDIDSGIGRVASTIYEKICTRSFCGGTSVSNRVAECFRLLDKRLGIGGCTEED